MFAPRVTIVIPNWNGRHLLEQHMPAVQAAVREYPGEADIVVVDDASTDDSADFLHERMPFVRVVRRKQNGGFAAACHSGIQGTNSAVVVLLNTDVEPRANFLLPLVSHFSDSSVFAVSCLGLRFGGVTPGEGAKVPLFRRGLLKLRNSFPDGACTTFFAVGGHCALDREKFLELDGFDDLFRPFYWEDVDLCYRAWKRAWRTIYEPHSVVIHRHQEGAIATSFSRRRAKRMNQRNRLLFIWKNLSSWHLLLRTHIPMLALRTTLGILWADFDFYGALISAIPQLPAMLKARRLQRIQQMITDEAIFRLWSVQ